ncbi:MAG: hypothetical protein V1740_03545 [Candidatus Woesearchaeota archaeon]
MTNRDERSPKLVEGGLTRREYGRLLEIDDAIDRYGFAVTIEVVNGISNHKKRCLKTAHAVDSQRFFAARADRGGINIESMVAHVAGKTRIDIKSESLDDVLMIPSFSPIILESMMDHMPRIPSRIVKRMRSPYNSDYYNPKLGGISPYEQQLVYLVVEESIKNKTNPDSVFKNFKKCFEDRLSDLAQRNNGSIKGTINSTRGAFLEIYVAESLVYALGSSEYEFFSRVAFPLWDSSHLNGTILPGERYKVRSKGKKRAEIDLIFTAGEKHYARARERVGKLAA